MTSTSAHRSGKTLSNSDASQFAAAIKDILPFLKSYAQHRLAGSSEQAEDFVQQAMLKAWAARSSFVSGTNLQGWIVTIIRNEICSHFRQTNRRRRWQADWNDQMLLSVADPNADTAPILWLRDTLKGLNTAVSAQQRAAILAVFAFGNSYDEVALLQGCPPGTAKSRVNRGLKKLRHWAELAPPATHERRQRHAFHTS